MVVAGVLANSHGGTNGVLDPESALASWRAGHAPQVDRVLRMLDDIRAHGVFDLATLSVALRELRTLTAS